LHSRNGVLAENAFLGAIRQITQEVPETDCVLATRPDLVNYYARRRADLPPLDSTPDPRFTSLVRRSGCNYVFGMSYKDSVYPVTMFPLKRLDPLLQLRYVTYLSNERGEQELIAALARLAPDGVPAP